MSWGYEIKARTDSGRDGVRRAEVLIFGGIGESWFEETTTAKAFVVEFGDIDADEIVVRINSHGGSVVDGLAIYNAIKRHRAKTITSVEGVAASVASYVAMAGDTRQIAENALYMMHGAWTLAVGDSTHMRETADLLDLHSAAMAAGYAAASGKPLDEIRSLLTDGTDHWYSAQDALAEGYFHSVEPAVEAVASLARGTRADYTPRAIVAATAAFRPKGKTMDSTTAPAAQAAPAAAIQHPDEASIRAAAIQAEARRRADIQAAYRPFVERDGVAELQAACVDDTQIDAQTASQRLLAHLGSQAQPVGGGSITTIQDEADKRRDGIVAALMVRAGVANAETRMVHAGNPWRGSTLLDVARASLSRAGVKTDGLDKMQIVGLAFTQSTSDFPVLLESVLHKTLQQAYAAAPDTWSRFCATGSVSDFRAHRRYRTGSIGNLDTITELGEFTHKVIPDGEASSITAGTRGNIITISRQAIVNDDLGAFTGLAASLGRAARRTIEATVYARLAENAGAGPLLLDGVAMFHASRNNIAAAAAPTVASFDSMRVLMAQQRDVGGNDFLDLRPAIWLGPMSLGGTARVVNNSEFDPDSSTGRLQRANMVRGLVRDIVDTPRLTGTAYYLFADPADAPAFEVAFLDGNDAPFLENQSGFNVDGVAWKVRLDFGVAPRDFRGAVRNPGA